MHLITCCGICHASIRAAYWCTFSLSFCQSTSSLLYICAESGMAANILVQAGHGAWVLKAPSNNSGHIPMHMWRAFVLK